MTNLTTTLSELKQQINTLQSDIIGVDIETTALDPDDGSIRLIQVSDGETSIAYDFLYGDNSQAVKDEFNTLFNRSKLIAHNAVFESRWFLKNGISFEFPLFDTMLAYQLIHAGDNRYMNKSGLEAVCHTNKIRMEDKTQGNSDWSKQSLTQRQIDYAIQDAKVLPELREKLLPQLIEHQLIEVATIEFRLVPVLARMSNHGILFDWDYLEDVLDETQQEREESLRSLENAYDNQLELATGIGCDRNLLGQLDTPNFNSHIQLRDALKQIGIKTESVAKDVLALHPQADNPMIRAYLEYKNLVTQCQDWNKYRKHRKRDDRVHTSIRQILNTGRTSSSKPNVQNLKSGSARQVVIAGEGNSLICADYSQIELRLTAKITGDAVMLQAYYDDKDIHKLTASKFFGESIDEITKDQRQAGKPANFGLIYKQSVPAFRDYAEATYGVILSMSEAQRFVKQFFDLYQGVALWHQSLERAIEGRTHYVSRTMSGRLRHLFDNDVRINIVANNPIQGTGADMAKLAMANVDAEYRRRGLTATIINIVHDEILVECPNSEVDVARQILIEEMEAAAARFLGDIPCKVDAGVATNWNDAKL